MPNTRPSRPTLIVLRAAVAAFIVFAALAVVVILATADFGTVAG